MVYIVAAHAADKFSVAVIWEN